MRHIVCTCTSRKLFKYPKLLKTSRIELMRLGVDGWVAGCVRARRHVCFYMHQVGRQAGGLAGGRVGRWVDKEVLGIGMKVR